MLRFILPFFLFASCSYKVVKKGGEASFSYEARKTYSQKNLKEIAPTIVTTSKRDPQTGTHDQVFGKGQKSLKRVGIILFETIIQPTRGGLADEDLVYLSAQGKQLLSEKLLSIWEGSFPILNPDIDYVRVAEIKKAKSFNAYGVDVTDHILAKREGLAPDDIFYLKKGKETTTTTLVNPRGMRDLSMLLIPGSEMLLGPKFSEHQKHLINDLTKELKLDAVIVLMSEVSWTAARMKKNSGEHIPEELKIKIAGSTLISFTDYQKRMTNLGKRGANLPRTTIPYGTYETEVNFPIRLDVPEEERKFETIEKEVLNPMLKTYSDLSQMIIIRMGEDLRQTF